MRQANVFLDDFLAELRAQHPEQTELSHAVGMVADACMHIAQLVRRGGLGQHFGSVGQSNVQGEDQQKLDVLANDMLLDAGNQCSLIRGMASEEMDEPVWTAHEDGQFLLVFDPLDGSSNISVNGSVGTIFSILNADNQSKTSAAFLQPGHKQLAAGYVLYSTATVLVFSTGHGSHEFTLDPAEQRFVLTRQNISIPQDSNEFAINAANERHWYPTTKRYIGELVDGKEGSRGKDYTMRWMGAMVGDMHRILCRGGMFLYPTDAKNQAKGGKLRLLYEANPMAMLIEQAGGLAIFGAEKTLDLVPSALHQRCCVIMGSKNEVAYMQSLFAQPS